MLSFSLSLWTEQDEYIELLSSPNVSIDGGAYDIHYSPNINGMYSLSFNIPMGAQEFGNPLGKNPLWEEIRNHQKIRLTMLRYGKPYDVIDFVLNEFVEKRSGLTRIASVDCELWAMYILRKIGSRIEYDIEGITNDEIDDFATNPNSTVLTIDYWLNKLFYYNTKLGRIETPTDYLLLADALSVRDEEGKIIKPHVLTPAEQASYYNPSGWQWEIISPNSDSIKQNKLYETPNVVDHRELYSGVWEPLAYGKKKGQPDSTKILIPFTEDGPIDPTYEYVTEIKRRLIKVKDSNIYNILMEICEKFEVWPQFEFEYDDEGKVSKQIIVLRTEIANQEHYFSIEYGINLIDSSRTRNTTDLTTKLTVPDIESSAIVGGMTSIARSPANFMKENYLLNFDWYFEQGALTKGILNPDSDEYKINQFMNDMRDANVTLTKIQNQLVPLYDARDELLAKIEFQQALVDANIENIQSTYAKIEGLPQDDIVIESWDITDLKAPNYPGEMKHVGEKNHRKYFSMIREGTFGAKNITYNYVDTAGVIHPINETFVPRFYNKANWDGKSALTNADFTLMTSPNFDFDYSEVPGQEDFIIGVYVNNLAALPNAGMARIRYEYSPLIAHSKTIDSLQDDNTKVDSDLAGLRAQLQAIQDLIDKYEYDLAVALSDKQQKQHVFERDYQAFIQEGKWEDTDYQTYTRPVQLSTKAPDGTQVQLNTLPKEKTASDKYTFWFYAPLNTDLDTLKLEYPIGVPLIRTLDYVPYYTFGPQILIAIAPTSATSGMNVGSVIHVKYDTKAGASVTTTATANPSSSGIIVERSYMVEDDTMIFSSIEMFRSDNVPLEKFIDYEYTQEKIPRRQDGTVAPNGVTPAYYTTGVLIKLLTTNNTTSPLQTYYIKYQQDITEQFFYNDAVATSKRSAVPKAEYGINIVNLAGLDEYTNYYPKVGYKVPIYDLPMGFNGLEGVITEIDFNLSEFHLTNITISNTKDAFADMWQRSRATTEAIRAQEGAIDRAASSFQPDGSIKESVFQKSLNENKINIGLGTKNDVIIDEEGILLIDKPAGYDPTDTFAVKMIGRGIFLTSDYDEYDPDSVIWRTGITGEGINASALVAGSIDTKNISIWSTAEDEIRFVWNSEGIFAYGEDLNGNINYKKYVRYSSNGLDFIYNSGGVDATQVSLGWSGLFISAQNGSINLTGEKGLQVFDSTRERIQLGRLFNGNVATNLYGLRINDQSGVVSMQTDSTGKLWLGDSMTLGGTMNATTGVLSGVRAGISGATGTSQVRFWSGHQTPTSGTFRVYDDGSLYATQGQIATWFMTADGFMSNATTALAAAGMSPTGVLKSVPRLDGTAGTESRQCVLWAGSGQFWVDIAGNARFGGATIGLGQWTIDQYGLRHTNGARIYPTDNGPNTSAGSQSGVGALTMGQNFRVAADGTLYATNGRFSGWISANSGTIGGFSIGATTLTGPSGFIINSSNQTISAGSTTLTFYSGMGGLSVNNAMIVTGTNGMMMCEWLEVKQYSNLYGRVSVYGNSLTSNVPYIHLNSSSGTTNGHIYSQSGKTVIELNVPTYRYFEINSDGHLYSNCIASFASDRRLKENIEYDFNSDFLYKLNPCSFNMNTYSKNKALFGLIAQEVEEVLNDFQLDNTAILTKPSEDREFYSLSYEQLIAPMIKCIQEQKQQIDKLTKQVESILNK